MQNWSDVSSTQKLASKTNINVESRVFIAQRNESPINPGEVFRSSQKIPGTLPSISGFHFSFVLVPPVVSR